MAIDNSGMNSDGGGASQLVGLNPGKAEADIRNINEGIVDMQRAFAQAAASYYENLSKLWYSPIAVQFYNETQGPIIALDEEIIRFTNKTISDCVAAFNSIAGSHGTRTISVSSGPFQGINNPPLLEISPAGDVIIETEQVKAETAEFASKLKTLKNSLSGIPRSIAFYDKSGDLARSCSTRIGELQGIVDSSIDQIVQAVSESIVAETMKVERAVASATEKIGSFKA